MTHHFSLKIRRRHTRHTMSDPVSSERYQARMSCIRADFSGPKMYRHHKAYMLSDLAGLEINQGGKDYTRID